MIHICFLSKSDLNQPIYTPSHDVIFIEDQIIQDINKVEKSKSPCTDSLVDLDLVPETDTPDVADFGNHIDASNHIPNDPVDDIDENVGDTGEPVIHLRRSSIQHLLSTG